MKTRIKEELLKDYNNPEDFSTITDTIVLLRYVEVMGEMRRELTVLKMQGPRHEKTIREYEINNTGMKIGRGFKNISGILVGSPAQVIDDSNKMDDMFNHEG